MTGARPIRALTADDQVLVRLATEARGRAYAPYSLFSVGAALRTRAGVVYPGCNVESATYGLTLCAERVALLSARSDGETEFEALAVAVAPDQAAIPCGMCRQLLLEICPDVRLLLTMPAGRVREIRASDLLPAIGSVPTGDPR
jgi:cytidine deaminase